MAQSTGEELFTTSWTLHRLSPLYHGKECQTLLDNPRALALYADRLRDLLRGDTLRGVQVGLDNTLALDDAIAKAGALNACKWEALPTWSHWNEEQSLLEDPDNDTLVIAPEESAGILVTLSYENATYKAALLAGPDGYHDSRKENTYFPLLVTRLPNPLRQTFISFLATNFDTHCSILRLPSSFLCAALENYLATLNNALTRRNSSVSARQVIERVVKDTQLTLTFPAPIAPALKSLDVHIRRESLTAFFTHGSTTAAIDNAENNKGPSTPFLAALSTYFDTHLAMKLNIDHFRDATTSPIGEKEYMRLTKVSCGAFVLGSEGRVKLLANPGRVMPFADSDAENEDDDNDDADSDSREIRAVWRANEGLLRALVERATV
ncbi:hypothetical protein AJ80_02868 [Polytolypa hystricis UAMH7299]|uniref:Uncharacterized protein n=1 Tax=Polytolypa hystricis (strain UAMH7299) TaxID=1447883 RepID=A0A2B7YG86_POLH7|nr:hypothetical protein AJ80_02868 [Polytolypa hystricis UAMH7299]